MEVIISNRNITKKMISTQKMIKRNEKTKSSYLTETMMCEQMEKYVRNIGQLKTQKDNCNDKNN